MIVWGGTTAAAMNTGGRYNPSTDSWVATSTGANAPSARSGHTAVWTGSEMIVWGGSGPTNTGGRYCVSSCDSPATWYPDADGDGYGVGSAGVPSCTQPPGYVAVPGDCSDSDPTVWAAPGEAQSLNVAPDKTTLTWSAPVDAGGVISALRYDLLRSVNPADFGAGATCVATNTSAASAADPAAPGAGGVFSYLVRARNACPSGQGPLGANSSGTQRTGRSCP